MHALTVKKFTEGLGFILNLTQSFLQLDLYQHFSVISLPLFEELIFIYLA